MNSLKLVFAAALASVAVVACGGAPMDSEDSEVAVAPDTDQVGTECMRGMTCQPIGSSSGWNPPTVVYDPGPSPGPSFTCTGDGPEGDGAEYRDLYNFQDGRNECWSSRPLQISNGIPWGYAMLSIYQCPAAYPVQRCDGYGHCQCWSY